jgi:hypothetical protein
VDGIVKSNPLVNPTVNNIVYHRRGPIERVHPNGIVVLVVKPSPALK